MDIIVTKKDFDEMFDNWYNHLVADDTDSIKIGSHYVTGGIKEIYDAKRDCPEYVYEFSIDNESADETEVRRLRDELPSE